MFGIIEYFCKLLQHLLFKMNKSFWLSILSLILISFNAIGQSVHLNYPANGYVSSKQALEVCWTYQQGNSYEIEVSTTQNFSTIFFTANNLMVRKIVIPNLTSNTRYYWRVRATTPVLTPWSYSFSFVQFNPTTLNNLSLWLKADSLVTLNGNNVLTWGDGGPNQYAVTQATAANQPSLIQNFCGNKPALKFDGNDAFEIPFFNYGPSNTVFVVSKKNAGGSAGRYIGCYNNELEIGTDLVLVSTNVLANYITTKPSLLSIARTPNPSVFYLNDSLAGSTSAAIPPLNNGGFYIGRSYSNAVLGYLQGEIAEIITSSSQLDDSLIHLTNRYLMDKYSEVLTIGNDTIIADNFCPLTLTPNNGFNNYLWSTGDTTSSLSVNSSGIYWLRAQDFFGRFTYDTIHVQFPIVNQIASQAVCYGSQVIWNTGLSTNYTHQWQDNSSLNQISINTAGSYFLKVTDALGCLYYSDTVSITIDNFSIDNSLGNDTNLCTGNTIQLQNNFSSGLSYLWSTGSSNDSLTINNTGSYWVEVSNSNNCILRDTINIIIVGTAPNALFSANNGCINAPVNFIDLSVSPIGDNIAQWLWDFGDGNLSTTQNNVHVYDSAGLYQVSLKVILQSGCGAILNQVVEVFKKPLINYTAFNLCNDKYTEFNNTSNLFGGSLQSVLWNFGDPAGTANTASTNQAFHNYNSSGSYLLQLTLETVEGCIDSLQSNINIKPSPVANFSTINQCVGTSTLFNDISEIDFPWQNLNRMWIFPNGDSSYFYQPSFEFDTAGIYPVLLFVQSTNGCSDTITKDVVIFNTPSAGFSFEKNCIGTPTEFIDGSVCDNCIIENYQWYVNQNPIGNTSNINYLFSDTGTYIVTLEVENNAACISSLDTIIHVNAAPISNFEMNSTLGSPPFLATFLNLSEQSTNYYWEFGDGTFSEDLNPIHTYNDTGTFEIILTALNNDNCSSISTKVLKLQPKIIDIVILNLSTEVLENYITTEVLVFNKGTTLVTGFEILLGNKSNLLVKEFYDGDLLPGAFKIIKLNTKINTGEGINESQVICLEITKVNEGIDVDLSNNSICKAISVEQFQLLNMFPNPAHDEITLNFISPTSEIITYQIYDLTGTTIISKTISSQKGFNQYRIETALLAAGSYICKVSYNGNFYALKFMKLDNQ